MTKMCLSWVKLNFRPVLFYVPKYKNQRKSRFGAIFAFFYFSLFILFRKGPRSSTEIFRTFFFYDMIMMCINFQLPEVAPHITGLLNFWRKKN